VTDKLKIYNGALSLIGERLLASLTEERESRRVLDLVYDDDGLKSCLESGQWYFAMRSQKITYDPSITPTWGYRFVFDVPTDHIRTCALCQDEFFTSPLLEYREEANFWYANLQTIYVRFVSNDVNYGMDLSLWPASFTEFVKAHFASKISPTVTASDGTKKDSFAYRRDMLKHAKTIAAMEDGTTFPAQGSWSQARQGNRRGWLDRGNKSSLIG
jgi:hypothetical protein